MNIAGRFTQDRFSLAVRLCCPEAGFIVRVVEYLRFRRAFMMSTILGDAFDKQIEIVVKQKATDRNESLSSASQQRVSDWNWHSFARSSNCIQRPRSCQARCGKRSAAERKSVSEAECQSLAAMYKRVVECSQGLLAASESYRALLNPDTLAALEKHQQSAIGFLDSEEICEAQKDVVASSRDAARINQLRNVA